MPLPVTHITGLLYRLEMSFVIQGKVVFQDIWDAEEDLALPRITLNNMKI